MPENTLTTPPPPAPAGAVQPHPRKSRVPLVAFALVVVVAGIGLAWWSSRHKGASTDNAGGTSGRMRNLAMRVEVVQPRKGGLGRTVVQPGLVHAFNKAELYAKVSGYLVRQKVDIGDKVKKGELLAEIDIPELFKSADQSKAALGQSKAKAKQADAHVLTARADRTSAAAQITQAEADMARFNADVSYRKKELDRINGLVRNRAVAQELADEQQKQYDAAVAAERSGEAAVASTRAQLEAAEARIVQAQADAEAAAADIDAATADLAKADVLLEYTRITAPCDGVVTLRSFHDGDFIRSAADDSGTAPVLSVKQNDLMRVIVLVPDLDVPYVKVGDPATIRVDALQGRTFEGKIARFASSENEEKLMRTEVDLPNPDDLLRDGMYGTATLRLEPPSNNLTVPSSCLIEQDGNGHGAVYVVRDDKAHRQEVQVDLDDGKFAEIVRGLQPDDQVIVRYNGSIAEGVAVEKEPLKAAR